MSEPVELLPFVPDYSQACVIDVLAMIDDPSGPAAHRVRLATDLTYALQFFQKTVFRALAVPPEFLGAR